MRARWGNVLGVVFAPALLAACAMAEGIDLSGAKTYYFGQADFGLDDFRPGDKISVEGADKGEFWGRRAP